MAVRKQAKRHAHKRISQKQVRKTARKAAVRIGVKTIEVKQAVSQRGRTHEMEAPLPGMPETCLLYTSPSPRDRQRSRMPSSA